MKLAIAVPTYNEAPNIAMLVPAIHEYLRDVDDLDCTVFIVDDNSPDGTAAVAERMAGDLDGERFRVSVLHRPTKEGLGVAYIDAFGRILALGFDAVIQMDADLSHDPRYLPTFLEMARTHDFVVGSRYVPGGGTPDWPLLRRLLSRGGNLYTRLFLGSKITDYTGGYNFYSADLLKRIDPESLHADGYGFLIELKHKALRNCDNIVQIPIIFVDRQLGNSKIPKSTIVKNLLLVPRIRNRH